MKAKLDQKEVNAIQYQEELKDAATINEKFKQRLIEEKEKRKKAEDEYRRYKGKLESCREMLNRSHTGEHKKKESVKPKEIELNVDRSSDGLLNVEKFKQLLTVTRSEQ